MTNNARLLVYKDGAIVDYWDNMVISYRSRSFRSEIGDGRIVFPYTDEIWDTITQNGDVVVVATHQVADYTFVEGAQVYTGRKRPEFNRQSDTVTVEGPSFLYELKRRRAQQATISLALGDYTIGDARLEVDYYLFDGGDVSGCQLASAPTLPSGESDLERWTFEVESEYSTSTTGVPGSTGYQSTFAQISNPAVQMLLFDSNYYDGGRWSNGEPKQRSPDYCTLHSWLPSDKEFKKWQYITGTDWNFVGSPEPEGTGGDGTFTNAINSTHWDVLRAIARQAGGHVISGWINHGGRLLTYLPSPNVTSIVLTNDTQYHHQENYAPIESVRELWSADDRYTDIHAIGSGLGSGAVILNEGRDLIEADSQYTTDQGNNIFVDWQRSVIYNTDYRTEIGQFDSPPISFNDLNPTQRETRAEAAYNLWKAARLELLAQDPATRHLEVVTRYNRSFTLFSPGDQLTIDQNPQYDGTWIIDTVERFNSGGDRVLRLQLINDWQARRAWSPDEYKWSHIRANHNRIENVEIAPLYGVGTTPGGSMPQMPRKE
ncbi:MAG: hypothetical protein M9928_21700 [Anaerolineae bacterium]|nr:hypothetical protein [Anaerolineae bacterium]MCO5195484.1 hypothetical protein [Anaerolineae bacterium]MCO5207631.1 hypothetical protein [Anaerolineae bacterium]